MTSDEYLEMLALEGARLRAQLDGNTSGAQDDSVDDGHEDADDDDDDEDTVFVSREYILREENTMLH
jgi:hypothetical protein